MIKCKMAMMRHFVIKRHCDEASRQVGRIDEFFGILNCRAILSTSEILKHDFVFNRVATLSTFIFPNFSLTFPALKEISLTY